MSKINEAAVVVLSGGQDSVTCLGLALAKFEKVYAIGFRYGQRHNVELECAQTVCDKYGVPFELVDLSFFGHMVRSSLTGKGSVSDKHPDNNELPASFVPNRNALFLTLAHAHAQTVHAQTVMTGVCQTDYSGYPDCRAVFIDALEEALNLGYGTQIAFETPLMRLTKAETFRLAHEVGFLDVVIEMSHTCYEGDRTKHHDWGYGCGECPACHLRARGWDEFGKMVDDMYIERTY